MSPVSREIEISRDDWKRRGIVHVCTRGAYDRVYGTLDPVYSYNAVFYKSEMTTLAQFLDGMQL